MGKGSCGGMCGGTCGGGMCGGYCGSGSCAAHGGSYGGGMCGLFGRRFHKGPFMALALLTLAVWLGFKARNEARQYDFIGVPIERNVITVNGEGKVLGIPDIATIDLGMTVEKKTVSEAQQENTKVMNSLVAKLKESGVAKEDIQTNGYSVYPSYDWNDGKQSLRGYTVSQNVHVKIRDLSKVGEIVGAAGSLGANQIGGISFTVDQPDALKAEARDKAIKDARVKADALAKAAGITLEKVVSFSEVQPGYPGPIYYAKDALGLGGATAEAVAPSVEAGSSEFVVNVSISYQIQ